jgi:3-dehydroquinate dehydratase/shikimate dehydrogenase
MVDGNQHNVRICVPVCERTLPELEQTAMRAAEAGDLVELRLDCLDDPASLRLGQLADVTRRFERPVIVTFRAKEQGGGGAANFANLASRRQFWARHSESFKEELIDLELDMVQQLVDNPITSVDWKRVICSHHDFEGVPSDLDQIYERMRATPAGILKIAVKAGDITDCIPVFHLLKRARVEGQEVIAIAMGPAGVATRILGPSCGAYLTYGALDGENSTAPGQVTAGQLRDLYRIDQITAQTRIMGLVGLPVGHSISPQIQNTSFAAAGADAVYLPFAVRDITSFMRRMAHPRTRELDWNLRGLSVTAPHKTAVIDCLDWIDPPAKEIGAVNTIVIEADRLCGYNTDATAVLKPVNQKLGSLRDARCAIIGAGGAASAALWSLKQESANATLFVRNEEKGSALAERFGAGCEQLDGAHFKGFDVVINATPLGTLGSFEGETAASAVQLGGARLAYDLVYNPSDTLFLRQAREAGCDTIGGLAMLVLQGVEQFRLWTGIEASVEVMREAAERAVKDFRSEI